METNLDEFFKADKEAESEGVKFSLDDDRYFILRRFHARNPRTKAALAAYYKPYAKQVEMGTLPTEKSEEITMKLFIDICLVSWTGITDKAGNPIECNKENALKLFKSLPDLFDTLWGYVNDFSNFKEDLGNS